MDLLHHLEQTLTVGSFAKFDVRAINPSLRDAAKAIQTIRQCVSSVVEKDPLPYHLGLLFHAAHRLMQFNPALKQTPVKLARFIHVLLGAAMICGRIEQEKRQAGAKSEPAASGFVVDQESRRVFIDGQQINLTGQEARLL